MEAFQDFIGGKLAELKVIGWLSFFPQKCLKMSKNRSEIEVKLLKSAKVNFFDLSILILAELAVLPNLRFNI